MSAAAAAARHVGGIQRSLELSLPLQQQLLLLLLLLPLEEVVEGRVVDQLRGVVSDETRIRKGDSKHVVVVVVVAVVVGRH